MRWTRNFIQFKHNKGRRMKMHRACARTNFAHRDRFFFEKTRFFNLNFRYETISDHTIRKPFKFSSRINGETRATANGFFGKLIKQIKNVKNRFTPKKDTCDKLCPPPSKFRTNFFFLIYNPLTVDLAKKNQGHLSKSQLE